MDSVFIKEERIPVIAEALKSISSSLMNLIHGDPQYKAVKTIAESHSEGDAALLVLLNSLISYQLSIPGEEYWLKFAEFFSKLQSKDLRAAFREFLKSARCTRSLDQKIGRIRKVIASSTAQRILEEPLYYCNRLNQLISELSRVLGVREDSKTLVFAAKMYGYFCMCRGVSIDYGDIAIPVDYRNSLLAITSCLIEYPECRYVEECARSLTTGPPAGKVREVWRRVCEYAETPCLLLDVFTWLFTGVAVEEYLNPEKTWETMKNKYGFEIPRRVVELLLECRVMHKQNV